MRKDPGFIFRVLLFYLKKHHVGRGLAQRFKRLPGEPEVVSSTPSSKKKKKEKKKQHESRVTREKTGSGLVQGFTVAVMSRGDLSGQSSCTLIHFSIWEAGKKERGKKVGGRERGRD